MRDYLAMEPPGPGSGPQRGGGGPGFSLDTVATVLAVGLLQAGEDHAPMKLCELAERTGLANHYRRLNSVGDAAGQKFLQLDRGRRNTVLTCEANLVRCAHWLRAHRVATADVARILGFPGGTDLLAHVGLVGGDPDCDGE